MPDCHVYRLLIPLLGERERHRDGYLTLIHKEVLIQPVEMIGARRREPRHTDHDPGDGGHLNSKRHAACRARLAIHVQAGRDRELEREPQMLEEPVRGGIQIGVYLDALGLCKGLSPMYGAFDPKSLLKHANARFALAVALREALLHHAALLVEEERARIGHPPVVVLLGNPVDGMMRIDVFVEQAKGADRLAPLIGKEGIFDAVFCRKPSQHVHRIIADRKEGYMGTLEVGETALQLNELCLAEWSPRGAAIEDHQSAMIASSLVQIDEIAMLIW
jgi:hypothetical protein